MSVKAAAQIHTNKDVDNLIQLHKGKYGCQMKKNKRRKKYNLPKNNNPKSWNQGTVVWKKNIKTSEIWNEGNF